MWCFYTGNVNDLEYCNFTKGDRYYIKEIISENFKYEAWDNTVHFVQFSENLLFEYFESQHVRRKRIIEEL